MKKKDYEKPTMQVVEVRQQQQLLAGSTTDSSIPNYDLEEEQDW